MNHIAEQFEEMYSRWSLLDKAGKERQLATMMNKAQGLCQYIVMAYGRKGYLTMDEYNQLEQVRQFHQYLQTQKMQIDQGLWNEMIRHLAEIAIKR